jgi:uncharacterized LabA/DUF88 family protein
MSDKSFCRIGVFYDGSYFAIAQRYFYHDKKYGWLDFSQFHSLIENYIRTKEQGFFNYKVVYSSWFQGISSSNQLDEHQLRNDRNLHYDLMYSGIEQKFLPMVNQKEKGVDVALAIDSVQVGLDGKIDIAVFVTGDADHIPAVRTLMKNGVRVMIAYFEFNGNEHKSFVDQRLRNVSNYEVDIAGLEKDKDFKTPFRNLFRKNGEAK